MSSELESGVARHVALVTFFASALVLGVGCDAKKATAPKKPPPPVVSVVKATTGDVPVYLELPGSTMSPRVVAINARVEGFISRRDFEDGSDVRVGQPLYQIDPAPFMAALAETEASLVGARADLEYAEREVLRNRKLVAIGATSQEVFDQLVTKVASAKASVAVNEAKVVTAELNLSYCDMFSPMDGRVGQTNVDEGNLVGPGINTKLTEIVQLHPMEAKFYVGAEYLPLLETRRAAGYALPVRIEVMSSGGEASGTTGGQKKVSRFVDGEVCFIDNQADQNTSTVLVHGKFPNEDASILPGQYVKVRLLLKTISNGVLIPTTALAQQPSGYYVWKVDSHGIPSMAEVSVGSSQGNMRYVMSGLAAGDTVIVDGLQKVRSGQKVTVKTAKAEAGGPKTDGDSAGTPGNKGKATKG